METLFIVASTRLRNVELASLAESDRIQLGVCEVVLLEEAPWSTISGTVVDLIPETARVVRVACHNEPCLGTTNYYTYQQEDASKIEELRTNLVTRGAHERLDLSVWGFHHVTGAPIYDALVRLKYWKEFPDEISTVRTLLLDSFRLPDHISTYDRLSVIKHRLIGLFAPINLQLQTLDELGKHDRTALIQKICDGVAAKEKFAIQLIEDAAKIAQNAEGEMGLRLGKKLGKIDRLVTEGLALLRRSPTEWLERFESIGTASSSAGPAPAATAGERPDAEFHKWLQRLDNASHEFRDATRSHIPARGTAP
jgi:hypothetical protein